MVIAAVPACAKGIAYPLSASLSFPSIALLASQFVICEFAVAVQFPGFTKTVGSVHDKFAVCAKQARISS